MKPIGDLTQVRPSYLLAITINTDVQHGEASFNVPVLACVLRSSHYQLTMKDLTRICAADVANVGSDISRLRGFVDSSYAQFALLGVQLMWTTDVQSALEQVGSAFRQQYSLLCA